MWLTIWCYDGVPFPGNEFPASFKDVHLRKMVRLLFHVLAHVYHSHFKEIVLLQLHAHLNALFAHFVGFSVRFSLLEDKELEVRMPICWTLDKKSSRSIQRSVIDTF